MRIFFLVFCLIVTASSDFRKQNSFQISTKGPVHKSLYGFNVQTFFENKSGIDNKELIDYYDQLAPEIVRFPGGGPSNYYRFDTINNVLYHPVKNWKIDLEKATTFLRNNKTAVILAINIYKGNNQEGIALTRFFKEKGIEVKGVELGNELYFKRYEISIQDYISKCKVYTALHRKEFPGIPVAALAAQVGTVKTGGKKDLMPYLDFTQWNQELSKEKFYDAVTFHWYVGQDGCFKKPGDIQQKISCSLHDLDLYTSYTIPEMLGYYKKMFNNREIWITEWNYFEPEKSGNTLLHAMFIQRFVFSMTISDANVRMLNYHNITTHSPKKKGYNLISVNEKGSSDRRYIPHLGYYAFSMMKDVFRNRMTPVEATTELSNGIRPYYTYAFVDSGKLLVFIANTSGKSSKIERVVYMGKPISFKNLSYAGVLSSFTMESSMDSLVNNDCRYEETRGNAIDYSIPPYSISKFEYKL